MFKRICFTLLNNFSSISLYIYFFESTNLKGESFIISLFFSIKINNYINAFEKHLQLRVLPILDQISEQKLFNQYKF